MVLGIRELNFAVDQPVLFISSENADGYDFVVDSLEIQAAFNTGEEVGDLVFANLASLPAGLMIDAIKIRETNDEIWVHSICGLAINRRLIDPTRNTAQFFGIPEPDSAAPFVVSAEKGTRIMADLIEKRVSFRYVPPWPWSLVAQLMKLLPVALLRKL